MENSNPQNWSWRFQWSQLTLPIQTELKRLTQIYGRDLLYRKAIPPKDIIMKNDSSFFSTINFNSFLCLCDLIIRLFEEEFNNKH